MVCCRIRFNRDEANMRTALYIVTVSACMVFTPQTDAAISGTTRVASGLAAPEFATFAPGDPNHLFVVQQGGVIKVVDLSTKTVLPTPFLTVPDTDAADEGGLLGLAFHPNYNK